MATYMAAPARTRLVPDKHLTGSERMPIDAFDWGFQRPAAATGGVQFPDHAPTLNPPVDIL